MNSKASLYRSKHGRNKHNSSLSGFFTLVLGLLASCAYGAEFDIGVPKDSLPPNTQIIDSGSFKARVIHFAMRRFVQFSSISDIDSGDVQDFREFQHSSEQNRSPRKGVVLTDIQLNATHSVKYNREGMTDDYVVFSIHGGGYISGTARGHYNLTVNLMDAIGGPAYAPTYRLAPEHPYPAAVDDVEAAYLGLLKLYRADRIIVAGESAGGGLTLALMLRLKNKNLPQPLAAIVFSPWVDLTLTSSTLKTHADRDLLDTRHLPHWADAYRGKQAANDSVVSPVFGDFSGLPPTLIMVGSEEMMLGDSILLQRRMQESGVKSTLQIWPRMWHVWPNARPNDFVEVSQTIQEWETFIHSVITAKGDSS